MTTVLISLLAFVAALLPPALLWYYIWRKDQKPEPASWLCKAVCYGMAICFPVAVLEAGIQELLFGSGGPSTVGGTTAVAFLVAAIPEESFKLFVLWLVLRKNPYFDEHFDGIVYAVCVGLGFAAVENVFYILGSDDWAMVAVFRALLAVPGHYAFAVLMGYYYSVYHFIDRSPRAAVCILLVPIAAHGVYDSLAMSGQVEPIVGGLAFFVLIYFCKKMHVVAKEKILTMITRDEVNQAQTL